MPVLLVHGDNALEIDEAVASVRRPFQPADVLTFDGTEASPPSLTEACLTTGLFDPERLVIVHRLHERGKGGRKDADTEAIEALLGDIPPTTTLLLVCKGMAADHQLAASVRRVKGEIRACAMPRKQDLARWVSGRAGRHGARIDPAAAELLADLVGANPLLLDSELEKLATYAGEEARISPDMVETLVGAVPQDSIFALVDAIAAGDRGKALRLLHAQLDRSGSGHVDFALYLIRMLARQVRILLRIRLGREAGRSTSQITSELKLNRYYADRYFRQANRLSSERLCDAFEQLAGLEHALKSGRSEPGAGLDLLVAELCA
ncbi:MAG: DNA polymerase III subunit delta [Chloroflexi bacterium]|nr:DNA polymerase III subunit delta [Chloroflexota bacterium]